VARSISFVIAETELRPSRWAAIRKDARFVRHDGFVRMAVTLRLAHLHKDADQSAHDSAAQPVFVFSAALLFPCALDLSEGDYCQCG
jgi:hypothetical protein